MFERFAETGGTFIDTAESYQFGESEEIIGGLLGDDRDHFTLATKYSNGVDATTGLNGTGNGRKAMVRAVEGSLRRLNTDHIDLLWAHFPNDVTPAEEIVRGLDDLMRSGKILHGGLSNFPAWRVSRAATIADLRGWSPIIGVQLEYSLVERSADREQLPMAEALGLGAALWSPLGGGLLTGKYRTSDEGRLADWNRLIHTEDDGRKTAIVDEVLAVAKETGATPAQVSMAWLRERSAHAATPLVSVIGPRDTRQLEGYLGALDVVLTSEQYARLTETSAIALGQPYEQIAATHDTVLGGRSADFRTPAVPVA